MDDLTHGVSMICACFEPQSSQSRNGKENGCKHQDLWPRLDAAIASHGRPVTIMSCPLAAGAHVMKLLRTVTQRGCSSGAKRTCSHTRRCRARSAICCCGQSSATRHKYDKPAATQPQFP